MLFYNHFTSSCPKLSISLYLVTDTFSSLDRVALTGSILTDIINRETPQNNISLTLRRHDWHFNIYFSKTKHHKTIFHLTFQCFDVRNILKMFRMLSQMMTMMKTGRRKKRLRREKGRKKKLTRIKCKTSTRLYTCIFWL